MRTAEPDGYRFLPAGGGHIDALPAIEREAAGLFPPGTIPKAMADASAPIASLRRAAEERRLWVAAELATGNPVGFALLEYADAHALLAELDVLPAHGRRGVGRRLVECVAGEAYARGDRDLYLTTFEHLPWNAPFYARLGFQAASEPELPRAILAVLNGERASGLCRRVAMRLRLPIEPGEAVRAFRRAAPVSPADRGPGPA